MVSMIPVEDVAIWFKHVSDTGLRKKLNALSEDEMIYLEVGGAVGRWRRMRQGKNPRPTEAIKPDGAMQEIWNEWFKTRKGQAIEIREVLLADDVLQEASVLFPEWNTQEDEEAFRDL